MRHEAKDQDHEPSDDLPPVRIDVERMAYALATETVHVPPGLTRDELLKFILAAGRPRQE